MNLEKWYRFWSIYDWYRQLNFFYGKNEKSKIERILKFIQDYKKYFIQYPLIGSLPITPILTSSSTKTETRHNRKITRNLVQV